MDGRPHVPRSQRLRLCAARLVTLLCIGTAALASCQPFRADNTAVMAPSTDFADYDACVDRGGRWLIHAHRCKEPPAPP
ncbi:hypothetical protein FIV34_02980 [Luteibacter pinisoli]|jgi:hypothetical protein|uniref:Lipoprotein n=1 Tax=Luteibacter pinisoli TaxID=2589080 RepID=A0A4Y5YZ10_9GAMM|nr:hypothetical protein [Luteibacter pinisoli]QDE38240.1 hypothetical protein FIV34_02980 [Luteibacter pinisoli]